MIVTNADRTHVQTRTLRTARSRAEVTRLSRLASHRPWRSTLPPDAVESIQRGTAGYSYRGIRLGKNPFDLALYQLLIWELKPRMIIEVGSGSGASALWFSDLLERFGVRARILSIDIRPPNLPDRANNIRFIEGDGRNLAATLPAELLADLQHPLLLVEDADHTPETTLAALRFFDRISAPGDY